ncbi:MAG: acetyl-CoA carboxylase biotin carboxyl carrier protein subunit [Flavobacteriales bacterium]|nr:acetyl-CoA carboxylase biotin carboxyl carrier protein subunit [Flavobacteriales bacterium]|tara:strand:+ start:442 stop:909 length:468 start_codon:yes stop_codon:yes gene_type:complete
MKGIVNSQFNFEIKDGEDWDIVKTKDGLFNIIYKEKSFIANVLSHDKKNKVFEIVINNNHYKVQLKDSFDEALIRLGVEHQEVDKDKAVVSPMPGKVVEVFVSAGDSVDEGDSLIVLEAMKMENIIKATKSGEVEHVYASVGDSVEKNCRLLVYK